MTPAVVEVGWTSTRPRTLVGCAIPNLVWILLYLSLTGVPYYSIQLQEFLQTRPFSAPPFPSQGTLGNEKSYWSSVGGKTTRFSVPFQKCKGFGDISQTKRAIGLWWCVWHRGTVLCVGHTAWAPEGRKGWSQGGLKGRQLEVGARRAPRLLVCDIGHLASMFAPAPSPRPRTRGTFSWSTTITSCSPSSFTLRREAKKVIFLG